MIDRRADIARGRRGYTRVAALACALGFALAPLQASAQAPTQASAQASNSESVVVSDPYLEMRTGPGRGYPIYFVAARGESIEILLRKTDWFKVRTANGKEGWVNRAQLETTLTEAGTRKTFRDVVLEDYLQRRLELGAAWGQFKSEPMLKLWSSYRVSDTLAIEGTIGQVQGVFSGTDFWHVNLMAEPWSDRRWSPFFAIGVGRFRNIPNSSLVSATTTNAKLADASVGLKFYINERFVARADYTLYTAFIGSNRISEYRAPAIGLSFFF